MSPETIIFDFRTKGFNSYITEIPSSWTQHTSLEQSSFLNRFLKHNKLLKCLHKCCIIFNEKYKKKLQVRVTFSETSGEMWLSLTINEIFNLTKPFTPDCAMQKRLCSSDYPPPLLSRKRQWFMRQSILLNIASGTKDIKDITIYWRQPGAT